MLKSGKRKRLFDSQSTDDYDGSRPLKFKKGKRTPKELDELELEMKQYRKNQMVRELVIFFIALVVTSWLFIGL